LTDCKHSPKEKHTPLKSLILAIYLMLSASDSKPAIPLAGCLAAGRQSLCEPLAVIESAVQAGQRSGFIRTWLTRISLPEVITRCSVSCGSCEQPSRSRLRGWRWNREPDAARQAFYLTLFHTRLDAHRRGMAAQWRQSFQRDPRQCAAGRQDCAARGFRKGGLTVTGRASRPAPSLKRTFP